MAKSPSTIPTHIDGVEIDERGCATGLIDDPNKAALAEYIAAMKTTPVDANLSGTAGVVSTNVSQVLVNPIAAAYYQQIEAKRDRKELRAKYGED